MICFWRCKPIEAPLSEIGNVCVATSPVSTENGTTTKECPEVKLTSGRAFALPCASLTGKSARQAVEQMRTFLGLDSAGTS